MVTIDTIKETYPLHWLVWNNDYIELDKILSTNQVKINNNSISFFIIIKNSFFFSFKKKITKKPIKRFLTFKFKKK